MTVAMALSLKKCYVALTYHPCKDVSDKEEQRVNVSHNHCVRLPTKTPPIIVASCIVPHLLLAPHHVHAACLYDLITKHMHVSRAIRRMN